MLTIHITTHTAPDAPTAEGIIAVNDGHDEQRIIWSAANGPADRLLVRRDYDIALERDVPVIGDAAAALVAAHLNTQAAAA